MLHTVNKSPFEHKTLETCLKFARQGSAVLLIEDGIYAAARDTAVSALLQEALLSVAMCNSIRRSKIVRCAAFCTSIRLAGCRIICSNAVIA